MISVSGSEYSLTIKIFVMAIEWVGYTLSFYLGCNVNGYHF